MKIKMNEKEWKEFTGYIEKITIVAVNYPGNQSANTVTESAVKLSHFISKVVKVRGKGRK